LKLSDRYTQQSGTVYLTGIQALVRLPVDQMRRDRAAGLNMASFISGYEGSPLAGYDMALLRTLPLLREWNIHFQPGLNEDLAASSVMGSQVFQVVGQSKFDGVLGIWYGKGPGVDRTGDVFRHANMLGSARHNAALVLAGDDHGAKSSTIPHQSDLSLYNVAIPVVYPGNTQEVLDYGLMAIAMSRFSGAWVGMKMVTNVCDGGGTAIVDADRVEIRVPPGYQKYTDPRLVTPITHALEYEAHHRRLEAVRDFARLNKISRWSGARENAQLGIAASGKAYYDLMQALRDLQIREEDLPRLGIRIAKFGLVYPLEPEFTREFARGLRTLLVVEEKRSFLEFQLRDLLYPLAERPAIIGKIDAEGKPLLPSTGELDPDFIARVVGRLIATPEAAARLRKLEEIHLRPRQPAPVRTPTFCSGCPHNRSTLLLDGQMAGGGIGCSTMSIELQDTNRGFEFMTQMGSEGAPWIGISPFTERKHVFQNIGDGTYFHSGSLAVEACIAAGVNITYKILYNGHVSMTGGQDVIGATAIPDLTRKLQAEGVERTVVLAEEPAKYSGATLASNAEVRDRSELPRTLKELEMIPGVTVIIYDQECAAEKRRKRSRGKLPEPVERIVINEEVCEGCGDCVKQSNCVSLQPVATPLGQKMRVHQSSCNKDYSCVLGDCPSFVTVRVQAGTALVKPALPKLPESSVTEPVSKVSAGDGYRIIMPGIGGTGVVTINALLATAALMDDKRVHTLDQTGLAQKGGAVVSHIIISDQPLDTAAKINSANADLLIGFDLLGAVNPENLKCADRNRTVAVINTHIMPTPDSIRQRVVLGGAELMIDQINDVTVRGRNLFVDASRLSDELFGSHMTVNIFQLGVAYQAGLIPLTAGSIEEAIRLNDVSFEKNLQAFLWGRKYYADAAWVEKQCKGKTEIKPTLNRMEELTRYQNSAYAREYEAFVQRVDDPDLRETVARYLFKLMAYKDEYEVARLLTKPQFESSVRGMWQAPESITYNLHPPLLRSFGVKRKLHFGPWFRTPLRILAAGKFLRGTPFDIFGMSRHRREERGLIEWYRDLIEQVIANMAPANRALALEIAALPDQIRGYEQIKEESIGKTKQLAALKLAEFTSRTAIDTPVTPAGRLEGSSAGCA